MAGYLTPQELRNGSKDAETLAKFGNDPYGLPNINRAGNNVSNLETIRVEALEAAAGAANLKTYLTRAAMQADTSQSVPTTGRVTNDSTPANNGDYVWNGLAWVWSAIQPASQAQLAALDALVVNRGKPFPLRSAVRAGISSGPMAPFNNLLLQVRVDGAEAGKLYRVAYQRNGASTSSPSDYVYGWVLEEYDEATYGTTGVGERIHFYTDPAPNIDRNGGIQTLVVTPQLRPNMRFRITLDAAQLPALGVAINSYSDNATAAWSWVVDPSCYVPFPITISQDDLTINLGKDMPLRRATRGGFTSAPNMPFNNFLLRALVVGGDLTKIYRIAYFQNGALLNGVQANDWIIEEWDAATYATAPVGGVILSYDDAIYGPQEQVNRNGGVQTIRLYPKDRPSMVIYITCDASRLPPVGTTINAYGSNANAGWSYVVDPSCVIKSPGGSSGLAGWDYEGIRWSYLASTKTITMTWRAGAELRRQVFGPKGVNGIPDIKANLRAALGDPELATWTTIIDNAGGGDWTPPICNFAISDGDGATTQTYTGGNHAADGSGTGTPTGRNILFSVMPDGQPLAADGAGVASRIVMASVNRVQAANTLTLVPPRETMEQRCIHIVTPAGTTELMNKWTALEAVRVVTDNGPQVFTVGYQSGTLMFYGKSNSRIAFTNEIDSGVKSSAPSVWGVSFRDASNGELQSWMDRSYEAGDGRYVATSRPLIRGGNSTGTNPSNTKFYHAAVAGMEASLAAGESYQWRGGWAHRPLPSAAPGFDGVANYTVDGRLVSAIVKDNGLSV